MLRRARDEEGRERAKFVAGRTFTQKPAHRVSFQTVVSKGSSDLMMRTPGLRTPGVSILAVGVSGTASASGKVVIRELCEEELSLEACVLVESSAGRGFGGGAFR